MKKLPLCQDKRLKKCIDNQIGNAQIKILKKPCTKLQYRVQGTEWRSMKNEIVFELRFAKPNEVKVYEEYLIYDFVAMLGAIGGTLGLCIGFSFLDVARTLSSLLVKIISYIEKHKKKDEVMFVKPIQVKEMESTNLRAVTMTKNNTLTCDEMVANSVAMKTLESRVTQQEVSINKLKELIVEIMRK